MWPLVLNRKKGRTTSNGRTRTAAKATWWTRRLWMQLAAVNALASVLALLVARQLDPVAADLVRNGAQMQFIHSMASIACATFMNVGAMRARLAPAFFLSGSLVYAGTFYGAALLLQSPITALLVAGAMLIATGWSIIIWAGSTIDSPKP